MSSVWGLLSSINYLFINWITYSKSSFTLLEGSDVQPVIHKFVMSSTYEYPCIHGFQLQYSNLCLQPWCKRNSICLLWCERRNILYLLQEQVREDTNVLWLLGLPAPQHNALSSHKLTSKHYQLFANWSVIKKHKGSASFNEVVKTKQYGGICVIFWLRTINSSGESTAFRNIIDNERACRSTYCRQYEWNSVGDNINNIDLNFWYYKNNWTI